jgi:AraC-like DNA-binding protein
MTAGAKALISRASAGPPQATESAVTAKAYVDALGRLGYDTETLLRDVGLDRSQLSDPEGRVPCACIGALLGRAMHERPITNAGMRIAMELPIGAFPLIDYLVLTSQTVGRGLEELARYFRLVAAVVELAFREEGRVVHAIYVGPPGSWQYEFSVVLCLLHLREETNGRFRAEEVSLTGVVDDVAELERVVGCPVRASASWNGWTMSREMWDLPLRRRDPVLSTVLRRHAGEMIERVPEAGGVECDARRELASRVAGGDTRIESVARALAVSVRTFQRRLADEGQSYQALLDAARKEAADRYVAASSLSIGEVAFLLGYSEPAAFHRAFKRWFGVTPHEYRNTR